MIYESKVLNRFIDYKFILVEGIHAKSPWSRDDLIELSIEIDRKYKVCSMFISEMVVFSPLHIISAVEHAVRSVNVSKRDLKIEVSLYILAKSQISEALAVIIPKEARDLCVVILAKNKHLATKAFNEIIHRIGGSIHPEFLKTEREEKKRYQESIFMFKMTGNPTIDEKQILEKIATSRQS